VPPADGCSFFTPPENNRLQDARTGWDRFDITLLRPQGWLAEHSFAEYHGRQPPSHA